MAFNRYSIGGNDEYSRFFKDVYQGFDSGLEDRPFTSPGTTLYDTISDRSTSPSCTAGTAVEEVSFAGWGFKSATNDVNTDSEDSDSDDESDDEDIPPIDLRAFEVRADGMAYPVSNDQTMYADQDVLFTEDAEADDDDDVGEDVRVESEPQPQDESHELPYLPSSPAVDFRHTSVPPVRLCSPVPTLPAPTRRRAPKPKPSSTPRAALIGPDQDADYESDNDTPSDDEYHPSPPLNPKKRFSVMRTCTRASKKQRLSPSPAPFRASSSRRPRAPPPSRNKQTSAIHLSEQVINDYKCPVCDWVQENRRKPDFLRHLNTHARAPETDQTKGWWCKGVRLEDLDEYNRGAREDGRKTISRDMEPKQFRDHVRIGGCLQNFSRRDALKRHLDNPAMACAGFACKAMDER